MPYPVVAAIANCRSRALDELASDTNHRTFGLQAGLLFSLRERILTVAYDTSNVSNRTRVHITQLLMRLADTDDIDRITVDTCNQRLNIFGPDIESDEIIISFYP